MLSKLTSSEMSTRPNLTPSGRIKPIASGVSVPTLPMAKEEFVRRTNPNLLPPRRYDASKRTVDLICGALLALVIVPVILFTAILVRLSSRGPAFYVQTRVGRFGHCFHIYKLRTMQHNCELHSGARWAAKNDSRVTWIGSILRRTHLDELPQLWNVMKGDMSLVGPRPERPEFTHLLEAAIPHYKDRMLVRPGVTGLAQVYLPPDTDVKSVERKLLYDLRYIRSMSLWFDLRLMGATFFQAVGIPCGLVRFLLLLPSAKKIKQATSQPIVMPQAVPTVNPT